MNFAKLRSAVGRMLSHWQGFWRKLEGPELEPRFWHSHYLSYQASLPHLREFGSKISGLVIDLGAGTGHGARYLNDSRSEYYPTDLPTGRDVTDTGVSQMPIGPVHFCSVYELPFEEGHFGGAIMLSVLEHLEQPAKGLAEIYRVLKPESYFLVSTPFAFPLHGAPDDFRRWTLPGMENELKEAGFEIVKSANCGGGFATLAMNFHLLVRHHLPGNSRWGKALVALLLPVILVEQAVVNVLALLLDRFDRSGAFPLAIAVLAKKPKEDAG